MNALDTQALFHTFLSNSLGFGVESKSTFRQKEYLHVYCLASVGKLVSYWVDATLVRDIGGIKW